MNDYQETIQNNPDFGFFHSSIWQRIIHDVYKVQPKPLFSMRDSEYAFLTNFEVNNLFSGHKFTNMPFNFYPIPLYNSKIQFIQLINNLGNEATRSGAYIEIKMINRLTKDILEKTRLIEIPSNYISILKLPSSYENYRNQISKNLKSNLKKRYNKYSKVGFKIKNVANLKELDKFYSVFARIYRNRHKMICQPKRLFKKLFQMKDDRYSFEIKTIRNQNDQICSAISVIYDHNGIAYYPWGITDQKYYKYALSYILINELIKDCINRHFKYIDFGSTPKSDQDLLTFKSRWGCENYETYYYYLHNIPRSVDLNSSYKLLRSIFSKTPMFIINFLNPYIIPHLV